MNRREWIGIAVAPSWGPIGALLAQAVRVRPDPVLDRLSTLQVAGMVAGVGLASAYLAMLIVGIPLHLLLRKRRWTSWWCYAAAAFSAGVGLRCLVILVIWLSFAEQEGLGSDTAVRQFLRLVTEHPTVLLTAGALAALIGGTFWLIARPDLRGGAALPASSVPAP